MKTCILIHLIPFSSLQHITHVFKRWKIPQNMVKGWGVHRPSAKPFTIYKRKIIQWSKCLNGNMFPSMKHFIRMRILRKILSVISKKAVPIHTLRDKHRESITWFGWPNIIQGYFLPCNNYGLVVSQNSRGRLNKKDGLTRYGDSHVKDKTS